MPHLKKKKLAPRHLRKLPRFTKASLIQKSSSSLAVIIAALHIESWEYVPYVQAYCSL